MVYGQVVRVIRQHVTIIIIIIIIIHVLVVIIITACNQA